MNIKKEEFYYNSADGKTKIYAAKWLPEQKPLCILQIIHGMGEWLDCYEEFALFLAKRRILVVGEDHLGHGHSVKAGNQFGYMCEADPAGVLVKDVHRLKRIIQKEYPGVPYFLLGHSMGSFMLRRYLLSHGKEIDGALILATGLQPPLRLKFGKLLNRLIAVKKGNHYRSIFMTRLIFRGFNKRIPNPKREGAWICKNEERWQRRARGEFPTVPFTMNGYEALMELVERSQNKKALKNVPKTLPILLASGSEDPLGGYGALVQKLYTQYRKAGFQNVTLRIYKNMRHEILNEKGNQKVYEELYRWIRNGEKDRNGRHQ